MEVGEEETMVDERKSVYKVCRMIKRNDNNSMLNFLLSIQEDSIFVGEISQIWCDLPLIANLRCGLWYSPSFHSTCYFKSTDGHTNNCSFSTSRLNLHIALLSGQKGGCLIVDSTRKGKLFPDSMSKTIPIWACVLNRAILNYRIKFRENVNILMEEQNSDKNKEWDCSLHLPLWVSKTEQVVIEGRLEEWTRVLESSGADIASLSSVLRKPLRPLWISQRTVIWLNEVPEHTALDFTPLLLISASSPDGTPRHCRPAPSDFTWRYIPGAGDDEESWARGLSPHLFWKHASVLTTSGPGLCGRLVAEIVEKERASPSHRGCGVMRQRSAFTHQLSEIIWNDGELQSLSELSNFVKDDAWARIEDDRIYWLGPTNIALCSSQAADKWDGVVDCVLNCDVRPVLLQCEAHLHLPITTSKYDRFSLLNNLGEAVEFARMNLGKGRNILTCCRNGEDVAFCVCLAIFTSLFTQQGVFDNGESFGEGRIRKWDVRKRLIYLCNYAVTARPSRANLRQVFNFLSRQSEGSFVNL